jgi:hypothetical protein
MNFDYDYDDYDVYLIKPKKTPKGCNVYSTKHIRIQQAKRQSRKANK